MSGYPDYPPPLGSNIPPPSYRSRDTYSSHGTRTSHSEGNARNDAYGLPPLPPSNPNPDRYAPTESMRGRQRGLTPPAWPPTPIDRYHSDKTGLGGDFGADLYGTRHSNAPYHATLSPRRRSSPLGLGIPGSPTGYTDLNAEYKFVAKAIADFEARYAHAPSYKKRFAPGSDHQQRIEAVMAKAREDFRKQGSGGFGLPEISSRRFPSPGYRDLPTQSDDRRELFDHHFADTQLPRDSRSYARDLPIPTSRDASYRSPPSDPYRKTCDSTRPRTRSPLPPPFPAPHSNAHDSLRPRSRSRPRPSPQPSSRCPSPFRRRRNEVPDEMWNAFFPAWRR